MYDGGIDMSPVGGANGGRGAEECNELASSVFQMTTQVSAFKKLVEGIGKAHDTHELRSRLKESRDTIQGLARENSTRVKSLSAAASEGKLTTAVKVVQLTSWISSPDSYYM